MPEPQKDWPVTTLWRKDGDNQITPGWIEPDAEVDKWSGMRYIPESSLLSDEAVRAASAAAFVEVSALLESDIRAALVAAIKAASEVRDV